MPTLRRITRRRPFMEKKEEILAVHLLWSRKCVFSNPVQTTVFTALKPRNELPQAMNVNEISFLIAGFEDEDRMEKGLITQLYFL